MAVAATYGVAIIKSIAFKIIAWVAGSAGVVIPILSNE